VRVCEFEPERGAAVTIQLEPEDAVEAADAAECVRRKVRDAVHRFARRSAGTDSNCDARCGASVAGSTCGGSAVSAAHACRSHVNALARSRGARRVPEAERARKRERPVLLHGMAATRR
jgi:hypothetical protein